MATLIEEKDQPRLIPVPRRVVGIDPGLNVTGYAVVEPSPHGPFVIEAGVIRPRSARVALGQRLVWIHRGIVEVLEAFPPGSVALERVHSHVSYPRTAAAQRQTPVFGYAATRIKKTLTGNGRAPKAQIQHAIMTELGLDRLPEPNDVADACAVALCHFYVSRNRRGLAQD
jgi:crossover junction endodeoxyribonuclease RuvC